MIQGGRPQAEKFATRKHGRRTSLVPPLPHSLSPDVSAYLHTIGSQPGVHGCSDSSLTTGISEEESQGVVGQAVSTFETDGLRTCGDMAVKTQFSRVYPACFWSWSSLLCAGSLPITPLEINAQKSWPITRLYFLSTTIGVYADQLDRSKIHLPQGSDSFKRK